MNCFLIQRTRMGRPRLLLGLKLTLFTDFRELQIDINFLFLLSDGGNLRQARSWVRPPFRLALFFSFTVTTRAVRPNPRKIVFWRVSANEKPKWRTKRTRTRRIRGTTTVALNSTTSRPSLRCLPTRPAKGKRPSCQLRSPALSSYPLHVQQSPCGRPMTSQLTGLYASPYQRKSS